MKSYAYIKHTKQERSLSWTSQFVGSRGGQLITIIQIRELDEEFDDT